MSQAEMTSPAETGQLRVAILSDSDKQRANLKAILEAGGLQVVENAQLCADSIKRIDADNADVLLVDMDDEVEHELDFLDELMESTIPILFNDAASTRMRAAQRNSDWGRSLARKLHSLAGVEVEPSLTPRVEESEATAGVVPEPEEAIVEPAVVEDIADYMVEADYLEEIEQQAIHRAEQELSHEQETASEQQQPQLKTTAGIAARNVWVIGASIGGPQSVKRFLAAIQGRLPVAFILAQHIGSNFVSLLAKQLDKVTGMKVMPAQEGHLLKHNEVVIAPTMQRITLDKRGYIRLKPIEYKSIYTPSIDTVMTDISMRYGSRTSALIFSGMGNDGVRGTQLIAARGGKIWAQDSKSCVISSMPDSSRRAGVVGFTGTPEELARNLVEHFEKHTR